MRTYALLSFFILQGCTSISQGAVTTLSDIDSELTGIIDDYYEITSVIPLQNVGDVMNVTMAMNLISVVAMETSGGYFTMSGYLTVVWVEGRHTPIADDLWISVPATSVWVPRISVINSATPTYKMISDKDVVNFHLQTNTVVWKPYILATVGCAVNPYFPFDEHTCEIKITSNEYDVDSMKLHINSSEVDTTDYVENNEWKIESTSVERDTVDSKSFVQFTITVRRGSAFYATLILSPVVMIGLLHLFVYFVPRKGSVRLEFSSKCVLMNVVVLLVTQTMIPPSNYPPSIVFYYLVAELLINVIVTVSVILLKTCTREDNCCLTMSSSPNRISPGQQPGQHRNHRAKPLPDGRRSNEVMSVWDDDETGQDVSGECADDVDLKEGGNHSKIANSDIFMFVTFLIIHALATIGFFVPMGLNLW